MVCIVCCQQTHACENITTIAAVNMLEISCLKKKL